ISFADSLYTPTQRLMFVFSFVDPVSFREAFAMNGLADEHPPSSNRPCRNQSNHLRQFLHIIRAQEPTQHLPDIYRHQDVATQAFTSLDNPAYLRYHIRLYNATIYAYIT